MGIYDTGEKIQIAFNLAKNQFKDIELFAALMQYSGLKTKSYWDRIGIGGSITATPVVYNETIYFGACDKIFYAVNLEGKELQRFKTNGKIQSYPAVFNDKVCFGSSDGNIYIVNAKTGKLLWKVELNEPVTASPVFYKNNIYVGIKFKV